MIRRIGMFLTLAVFLLGVAGAEEDGFLVRDMRVEGNQRITDGTIFNYLPVNIGDVLDQQRVREAIRALYDTKFFDDVELRIDDGALLIVVLERASIESFSISGNKSIKTEDMEAELRRIGLAEGKTFDRSVLEGVTNAITEQYFSQGKYSATVNTEVSKVGKNRVQIDITVVEGERATIRQINIVGNNEYSDKELREEMSLRQPHLTCFIKSDCRYSKETLLGDLEALSSFYLDRGHVKFEVRSTQVAISPDRNDIFLTINIDEGDLYKVSGVELAGKTILPHDVLRQMIFLQEGDTYSQRRITQSTEMMAYALGERGYSLAIIDPISNVNAEDKTVSLTFYVEPGNRVYVRRIKFSGTHSTDDYVFRREMRQMEQAWLSSSGVERSKQRIQRLPFVESIEMETIPVPGVTDMVDVEYTIKEGLPGSFGGGLGFSGARGLILNGNFVHTNFMGTGNRISVDLSTGRFSKIYSISHTNPYASPDGISRTVSVGLRNFNQFTSGASNFSTLTTNAALDYGIPISEYQRFRFGVSASDSELSSNSFQTLQSQEWVQNNGDSSVETINGIDFSKTAFKTFEILLGWTYDSRNRFLFADRGSRSRITISSTLPQSEVEYWFLNYDFQKYFPISGEWVFSFKTDIALGEAVGDTTSIPPFRNFFAGGPKTIRGYKENRLGPKDTFGRPYGGNLKVASQFELLVPVPEAIKGSARLSVFYDIGNVFSTGDVSFVDKLGDPIKYEWDVKRLKRSAGVAVEWLAPIGLFKFSYAIPLNPEKATIRFFGDQIQKLQFSIGSAF